MSPRTGRPQKPWGAGPDLYRVLDHWNSAYVKPIGDTTNGHSSRWSSPEMDAVIEKLRETDPADYEATVAVGIEGPEDRRHRNAGHPDLRLHRLHRLGPTYWTNWPGAENPYTQPYTHWGPFKYMTPFLEPTGASNLVLVTRADRFPGRADTRPPRGIYPCNPVHLNKMRVTDVDIHKTLSHSPANPVFPGDLPGDHSRFLYSRGSLPNDPVQRTIQETAKPAARLWTRHHGQNHRRPDRDVWSGRSWLDQYSAFWGRLVRGDFGVSFFQFPTPVNELIGSRLPWTLGLLLITTFLSWIVGNIVGGLAGYYSRKRWSRSLDTVAMVVRPLPYYIFAFALLLLFAYVVAGSRFPAATAIGRQTGIELALHQGCALALLPPGAFAGRSWAGL